MDAISLLYNLCIKTVCRIIREDMHNGVIDTAVPVTVVRDPGEVV
jgi:hypothetical protein